MNPTMRGARSSSMGASWGTTVALRLAEQFRTRIVSISQIFGNLFAEARFY